MAAHQSQPALFFGDHLLSTFAALSDPTLCRTPAIVTNHALRSFLYHGLTERAMKRNFELTPETELGSGRLSQRRRIAASFHMTVPNSNSGVIVYQVVYRTRFVETSA
jgi:hypothetical protein